jgi:hypothetical protein
MGCHFGSSGRVWGFEFKSQYHHNKTKEKLQLSLSFFSLSCFTLTMLGSFLWLEHSSQELIFMTLEWLILEFKIFFINTVNFLISFLKFLFKCHPGRPILSILSGIKNCICHIEYLQFFQSMWYTTFHHFTVVCFAFCLSWEQTQVCRILSLFWLLIWSSFCWASGAHICNPSYSRGRDQEDWGLKPTTTNSSWDLILKIPNTKERSVGLPQVVELLPSKHGALNSSPSPPQKKKF